MLRPPERRVNCLTRCLEADSGLAATLRLATPLEVTPETVARKLAAEYAGYGTLGLVDCRVQLSVYRRRSSAITRSPVRPLQIHTFAFSA